MEELQPDLSHLSAEEREIIESVLQRQEAEQQSEAHITQSAERELEELEREITTRQDRAAQLSEDDATCQICCRTKFADGIGHKCHYCHLRSCARCGGRTQARVKAKFQNVWACTLCAKKQQLMAKTGKWFHDPTAYQNNSQSSSPSAGTPLTSSHSAHRITAESGTNGVQYLDSFDNQVPESTTHNRQVGTSDYKPSTSISGLTPSQQQQKQQLQFYAQQPQQQQQHLQQLQYEQQRRLSQQSSSYINQQQNQQQRNNINTSVFPITNHNRLATMQQQQNQQQQLQQQQPQPQQNLQHQQTSVSSLQQSGAYMNGGIQSGNQQQLAHKPITNAQQTTSSKAMSWFQPSTTPSQQQHNQSQQQQHNQSQQQNTQSQQQLNQLQQSNMLAQQQNQQNQQILQHQQLQNKQLQIQQQPNQHSQLQQNQQQQQLQNLNQQQNQFKNQQLNTQNQQQQQHLQQHGAQSTPYEQQQQYGISQQQQLQQQQLQNQQQPQQQRQQLQLQQQQSGLNQWNQPNQLPMGSVTVGFIFINFNQQFTKPRNIIRFANFFL